MFFGPFKVKEVQGISDNRVKVTYEPFDEKKPLLEDGAFVKDDAGNILYGESEVTQLPDDEMSRDIFDAVVTEEPQDHNYIVKQRMEVIVKDVIAVFVRHNTYIGYRDHQNDECEHILKVVNQRIKQAYDAAHDKLWGEPEYRKTLWQALEFNKKDIPSGM